VKAVVMRDGKRIGWGVEQTGPDYEVCANSVLGKALEMAQVRREELDFILSTGYGRRTTKLAADTISEISANTEGTRFIAKEHGIHTIIDIGGQDTKVISLDDNLVQTNFAMNDKCAAGTGRFLEVLGRVLGITIDEMGPLSLKSTKKVEITTTCLVFAKSEVSALINKGEKKEDVIAGINRAIAKRLAMMAKKVGVKERVFFDGGPARNVGMIRALEEELQVKLVVPDQPQIVTATGAAVLAAKKLAHKAAAAAAAAAAAPP